MRSNENARRGTENVAAICDLGEESFMKMAEYDENDGGGVVDDMLGGACVTLRTRHASPDRAKVATLFFKRSFLAPSFNLH